MRFTHLLGAAREARFPGAAREAGLIAAMALLLAVQLPTVAPAQDATDRVTGFPREPVHIASWPAGRKVAVSFALFVEQFGFGQGPVFRPNLAARNRPRQ
jgi:allantoinase